jgi:hypothetical protein
MSVDKKGERTTPTIELDRRTLVFDRERNKQVMRLDGVVVLPVGAEIELIEPNVSAIVTGVRLLAGWPTKNGSKGNPSTVCIDVKVPAEWWGEQG